MNKKQLLLVGIVAIPVLLLALILVSGPAVPGNILYGIDRSGENFKLSFLKSVNKLSYGKFNLSLADERLLEIKHLQENKNVNALRKFSVYAQSNNAVVEQYISELLVDVSHNLTEAKTVLTDLPQLQKEELSLEIAEKTKSLGQDLSGIAVTLTPEQADELNDTITKMEEIDTDAVDFLAEQSEKEDDDTVSAALQGKLETKLLKLREQLRILVARLEVNKSVLTENKVALADALINDISTALTSAESNVGQQEFKIVADILDRTDDQLDTLKDIVKVDGNEDPESIKEDTTSDEVKDDATDDNGTDDNVNGTDDGNDNQEEDSQDNNDDNKPTPTVSGSKPVVSSTPRPTETQEVEPTEKPEDNSDDNDVQGVRTQPSSDFDWLRSNLRF